MAMEGIKRYLRGLKGLALPFALSSSLALLASVILMMLINSAFLRMPLQSANRPYAVRPDRAGAAGAEPDYRAIAERNLFRAKLKVELPRPKTEKELEEEALTNIMRSMVLKGVWIGQTKDDVYAVIDRGPQKGVWIFRVGDTAERGLILTEVNRNSVTFRKNDFTGSLKLFTRGFDKVPPPPGDTKPGNRDKESGNSSRGK